MLELPGNTIKSLSFLLPYVNTVIITSGFVFGTYEDTKTVFLFFKDALLFLSMFVCVCLQKPEEVIGYLWLELEALSTTRHTC